MKKIISGVLALLMILNVGIVGLANPVGIQEWDGTIAEPQEMTTIDGIYYYQITTPQELAYIAQTGGDWLKYNYILTNNIVLNDEELTYDQEGNLTVDTTTLHAWTPIGGFSGIFNGAGYTISGLYASGKSMMGLFSSNSGKILNLSLENSYVKALDEYGGPATSSGGICAYLLDGFVSNCFFDGAIKGVNVCIGGVVGGGNGRIETSGNYGDIFAGECAECGGIFGGKRSGMLTSISNCFNRGNIKSSGSTVGGIAGHTDGEIFNCKNYGAVTGFGCVGGVCGEAKVSNSYNYGVVTGTSNVGGICGKGDTSYSYNYGAVTGTSSVGGICGCLEEGWTTSYPYLTNNYNSGEVVGDSNVGGICGKMETGSISNCANIKNVIGASNIGAIVGYSALIWGYGSVSNCYYLKIETVNSALSGLGNAPDTENVTESKDITFFCFTEDETFVGLHVYTNGCDATCDRCGELRNVAGHKYTNDCDSTCDKCEETRDIEGHKYTNACDTTCDKCEETRYVGRHKYTNICDATCDICGANRTVAGHKYANACDPSCDICGATRIVEGHRYTNTCDTTCDKCGESRNITHSYSNACDTSCNLCGTTRSITHTYGSYVYNNDATTTKDGTKTATCTCGAKDTVTAPGTKLHKHIFTTYVYNNDATAEKDGTKTATCTCGAKDTVTAVGTKIQNPFTDVKAGEYYTDPVLWAVGKGITNGTSATSFSPNAQCTRGQIVTFLWRAAGSPEPTSSKNPFKDVKSDQYYYKAVLWAVEKGITTGISATEFAPNATCTRGQVVTFLWRAKGKPSATASTAFTDVKAGQYYTEAVAWAVKNGITTGISATLFAPDATCTRGQIVTFLYRAYK